MALVRLFLHLRGFLSQLYAKWLPSQVSQISGGSPRHARLAMAKLRSLYSLRIPYSVCGARLVSGYAHAGPTSTGSQPVKLTPTRITHHVGKVIARQPMLNIAERPTRTSTEIGQGEIQWRTDDYIAKVNV
ncbi:hypothetical protein CIHG_01017 [Coccidioides immitis H538.4]|uniref:Uncharacterized protein n=2 Tax=Coccidioides immitis TaxID=5501 RepID=A0A0J8RDG8_COCIT|nr:hypothetical protein CIRG_03427 [Coccidioides immitis RMSCC 2394]KMU83235.1 hypothetical protein CIHG_01017 [Coccidioides immitis H538.4]